MKAQLTVWGISREGQTSEVYLMHSSTLPCTMQFQVLRTLVNSRDTELFRQPPYSSILSTSTYWERSLTPEPIP